jgi:2',3'-cyclic-nucleotide 2'-phosphodiesterase / 3'-nucleotidase / 5'-nucleotidase
MRKRFAFAAALALAAAAIAPAAAQDPALTLTPLGTYAAGAFDEGAAEIVAYHPATTQLYVVNGATASIDILNIADPAAPALVSSIDVTQYAEGATHVTVFGDLIAIALENGQEPGAVGFFNPDGSFIASYEVGALPDMLTFTPDGTKVLTANEGEPNDDYSVDPEGSVSIVDISAGADAATVTTVGFADVMLEEAVRVYGPNATQAQDLEPEYIAVSPDGATAYVTLQEANALGVIDIAGATVTAVVPLGYKDHSQPGNELDASDEDGAINIVNHPVFGLYQPDAIAAYEVDGAVYLVTANEGDTRDYETFGEEERVEDVTLDAEAFPNAAELQAPEVLGRLTIVTPFSDTDGDGDLDRLFIPGGRSFSIWAADGTLVYDSGADLERITAELFPEEFNATNDENGSFDNRSDNKGPEPEGVVLGQIGEATYAFIGLERIGGVFVYDVTDPTAPVYVTYVNNRDFSGDAEAGTAGDLGPEGLRFIPAADSPTGDALLVVANEISGTTTIYSITQ